MIQKVKVLIHYFLFLITEKHSKMSQKISVLVFSNAFADVFDCEATFSFCTFVVWLDHWHSH